jgi:hypothetical protein
MSVKPGRGDLVHGAPGIALVPKNGSTGVLELAQRLGEPSIGERFVVNGDTST